VTHIEFTTGVVDPVRSCARLLAKVYAQQRVARVVTPDEATSERLDRLLWEEPPESFVPHVRLASPLAARTPIIIDHAHVHEGAHDVLINLALEPPPFFARFERLLELIATDEASIAAGRRRWNFYHERGYPLAHAVAGATARARPDGRS